MLYSIGRGLISYKSDYKLGLTNTEMFAVGFFTFTVIVSFLSATFPTQVAKPAILGAFVLCCLFSAVNTSFKVLKLIPRFLIFTGTICFLISIFGPIRFHQSVDIHGLASAASYLHQKPSFSELQHDFMSVTGLSEPKMLGQKTPKLSSTWNIADARLRFASDHILTVGRFGIAMIIASLGWVVGLKTSFLYITPLLGISATWVISVITLETFKLARVLLGIKSQKSKSQFPIIFYLTLSPISILMILEGAVIQLWVAAALAWQLLLNLRIIHLSNLDSKPILAKLFIHGLAPLFIGFIYPHALLAVLPVTLFNLIIYMALQSDLSVRKRSKYLFVSILSFTPAAITTSLLNRHNFIEMTLNYLQNKVGSPYSPGYISVQNAISNLGTSLRFTKTSQGGAGFNLTPENSSRALLSLLVVILILSALSLASTFTARSRDKKQALCLILIFNLAIALPVFQSLLKRPELSSYFYIRSIHIFLVLGIPILFAAASLVFPQEHLYIERVRPTIRIFGFILLILQFSFAERLLNEFKNSSNEFFQYGSQISGSYDPSNTLLLSSYPEHQIFARVLDGPLFYMTDTWNPKIYQEDSLVQEFNVIYVDLISNKESKIGNLTLSATLEGPLFIKDLTKYQNFVPNLKYWQILQTQDS